MCLPYIYYVTFQKIPYIYMKIFTNLQVTAKIYWQSRKREKRRALVLEFFKSLYFVFVFPLTFPIYLVFMNLIYVNDSNLVKVDSNGIINGLESISSISMIDMNDNNINNIYNTDIFNENDVTRILEVMRKKETIDGKLDYLIEEILTMKRQMYSGDNGSITEKDSILDNDSDPIAITTTLDYINPFNVVGSLFRPFTSTQRDLLLSDINDDVKTLKNDIKHIIKRLNH